MGRVPALLDGQTSTEMLSYSLKLDTEYYSFDFPSWGDSDSIVNSGSREALNARVVKNIDDKLGLTKIHLVGNSMGGHSSVAFTLEYPEYVGKLVLMGGGTGGISLFTPMPTEGMKLVTELYRNPTLENLKKFNDIFVYDSIALTENLL
jgi:2-hydroxy-6-oxonona-2,4-dienedioate hydrolase